MKLRKLITSLSVLLIVGACTTVSNSESPRSSIEKEQISTNGNRLNFVLHVSGPEVMDDISPLFSDYNVSGSNWKVRDQNSLYLRFSGDQTTDAPHLIPGYSHKELEQLTEQQGVLYWSEYPSRMWVSARNAGAFKQAWQTDDKLRSMIRKLAHNPYQKNSWYNLEGKPQNFDSDLYHEVKKHFDRQNRAALGIFDPQQVDYAEPAKYLDPGPQSVLSKEVQTFIHNELEAIPQTIEGVLQIQQLFVDHFSSGGIDDPRLTADDFIRLRQFSGCTEAALILSAVLRELEYPSVYIVTVDVPTAQESELGRGISRGHQMVEVFVEDKWILLDDWGGYTVGYDPHNPFIIRHYGDGSVDKGFVVSKGRDAWESGLLGDEYYIEMCDNFILGLREGQFDRYLDNPAEYQMQRY